MFPLAGFDVLNRQTVKTTSQYAVYTSYDLSGCTLSALFGSTSGQGVVYSYDAAGRRLSEATNGSTLTFAYDGASNRTGLSWPDGNAAAFTYDSAERMTSASLGGVSVNLGYDSLSRRAALNRSTGANTTYAYDAADRLTALSHSLNSTSANVTFGLGYTAASQLASRSNSNAAYDWSNPVASIQNYTADGLNRDAAIVAASGYDANGNLIFDGTRTFTYDAENRLTSVSAGGATSLSLAYDPLGRLQQTTASGTVTNFLYDGDALVAEYDGAHNLLRRYVHGPNVDEPVLWFEGAGLTSPRFLHADRQGSIIAWSDGTGTSQATYTYGPYGEPTTWSGSRFRYTGQIALPEAQLYYYKARVYDPMRGWFLQTDPVGQKDDPNLYAYVKDDPVNASDPTGEANYTIYRELFFPGSNIFHRSQVITECTGCAVKYYGYGPQRESISNPGHLVEERGSNTATERQDSWAYKAASKSSIGIGFIKGGFMVTIIKGADTDENVERRGNALDKALGNVPNPNPKGPLYHGLGVNSNTSNQYVRSGRGSSPPLVPGIAPGSGLTGKLPPTGEQNTCSAPTGSRIPSC